MYVCVYIYIYRERERGQWHPTPVLLPGKSHGWRSLVGCSPWDRQESDTTERLHFHFSLSYIGEGNGNPVQCSCLESPRGGRASWAALYGVAQSRTRLKWLSRETEIYTYIYIYIFDCAFKYAFSYSKCKDGKKEEEVKIIKEGDYKLLPYVHALGCETKKETSCPFRLRSQMPLQPWWYSYADLDFRVYR